MQQNSITQHFQGYLTVCTNLFGKKPTIFSKKKQITGLYSFLFLHEFYNCPLVLPSTPKRVIGTFPRILPSFVSTVGKKIFEENELIMRSNFPTQEYNFKPGMLAHIFNSSTWEKEAEGSL